jgi:hypothetical protein
MRTALAALAIALTACSTSAPGPAGKQVNVPQPDFAIHQLVGPLELNYPEGDYEVKYRLDIGNKADVPITLKRLEVVTVNPPGGAYTLDPGHRAYYFNKTINPHQIATIEFWARATGYGRGRRENEPVTVRGTLYLDTPSGYFHHVFVKELSQYGAE